MARGRILVTDDSSVADGGYALLRLIGERRRPDDLKLVIRRLSPPAYLSSKGWQQTEARIAAESAIQDEDGVTVLRLGPEVVDQIEANEKIEIAIPALDMTDMLAWPEEVRPSRLGLLPGDGRVSAGRRPPPRPAAAPPPPPPPPEPEPVAPEPEPVEAPAPVLRADPPAPSEEQEEEPPPPRRRRALLWNLFGLLFFALVLGGTWFARSDEGQRLLCDWGLVECAPSLADLCPKDQPLAARADCLARSLSTDELFALAEQYGTTGQRDLALLLLQRLNSIGYAKAMLELALCYDPLLPDGCSLLPRLSSNALQAARLYGEAKKAGDTAATDHLQRLCTWLKEQKDLESEAVWKMQCEAAL